MLIWDEAIGLCQWWSKDSSSETLTKFKLLMNMGYKEILANFRRNQTLQHMTRTVEADRRSYILPPDFLMPKKIKAQDGDTWYPVTIIESEEMWDEITSQDRTMSRPTSAFFRFRFGVGGAEVLLDPIPSNSDTIINITYEATDKDLSILKYNTGTIAATLDSAGIVGTGTTFTSAMVGRYLQVNDADGDGMWYRIASFTDATHITLENYYAGATITGKNYSIAEAFGLPEEMQVLPAYYAMWNYWSKQGNDKETKKYFTLWNNGWDAAKDRYTVKSLGKNVKGKSSNNGMQFAMYPGYFPTEIS